MKRRKLLFKFGDPEFLDLRNYNYHAGEAMKRAARTGYVAAPDEVLDDSERTHYSLVQNMNEGTHIEHDDQAFGTQELDIPTLLNLPEDPEARDKRIRTLSARRSSRDRTREVRRRAHSAAASAAVVADYNESQQKRARSKSARRRQRSRERSASRKRSAERKKTVAAMMVENERAEQWLIDHAASNKGDASARRAARIVQRGRDATPRLVQPSPLLVGNVARTLFPKDGDAVMRTAAADAPSRAYKRSQSPVKKRNPSQRRKKKDKN